jgi:hypothetical protein
MRPSVFRIAAFLVVAGGLQSFHSTAMASGVQNAAGLEHAVLSGKDIHVVIDLSACMDHSGGRPGPDIRGSLHPNGFMVLKDHSVAFAVTHFTVRPDDTADNEFMSFRVQPDGKVSLRNVFLNAANESVLQKAEFDCAIGKGVTFH